MAKRQLKIDTQGPKKYHYCMSLCIPEGCKFFRKFLISGNFACNFTLNKRKGKYASPRNFQAFEENLITLTCITGYGVLTSTKSVVLICLLDCQLKTLTLDSWVLHKNRFLKKVSELWVLVSYSSLIEWLFWHVKKKILWTRSGVPRGIMNKIRGTSYGVWSLDLQYYCITEVSTK